MRQLKIERTITDRSSKSVDMYFTDINNEADLITSEEEHALCVRIQEGDKYAMERLIVANLRFVVSVAKQYHIKGVELPDLINEGNIGLIVAAERFDKKNAIQ